MAVLLRKNSGYFGSARDCLFATVVILFIAASIAARANSVPDSRTSQRRRRGADTWIPYALNNFCPWAKCQGWIGCSPGTRCGQAPTNFVEQSKRRNERYGTCYAYSPRDDPAPNDRCNEDGPREDLCACITDDRVLQIGYADEPSHPQTDAHISVICASPFPGKTFTLSDCPTTTRMTTTRTPSTTVPQTTSTATTYTELATTMTTTPRDAPTTEAWTKTVSNTMGERPTRTTNPTSTLPDAKTTNEITEGDGAITTTLAPGSSLDEGADFDVKIWLPVLIGGVLVVILLAVLIRRRLRSRDRPAAVKTPTGISTGAVAYSAVSNSSSYPDVNSNRDVSTVSNPSYEPQISGNELERGGDFFCPPLENTQSSYRAKGKLRSPGQSNGEIHGNPPALLGNHNAGFSDGNYFDIDLESADGQGAKPISPGEGATLDVRGSRYEPHFPKQIPSKAPKPKMVESRQQADAGYENPGRVLSPGIKTPSSKQPPASGKHIAVHSYEETPDTLETPPSRRQHHGDSQRSEEGAHEPGDYEVTEIHVPQKSPRTAAASVNTSYEIATIDSTSTQSTSPVPKYAKADKKGKGKRTSPAPDPGYEVANVSPGHSPTSNEKPKTYTYAYAYTTPPGVSPPPGTRANTYNVLHTESPEANGEYSMLQRSKDGSGQAKPTLPIIMSANVYNKLEIAS